MPFRLTRVRSLSIQDLCTVCIGLIVLAATLLFLYLLKPSVCRPVIYVTIDKKPVPLLSTALADVSR